jgi:hypothetical protein
MTERLLVNSWSTIPVLPSMRFKVVGFSYQTQILQKSVPEHRTPLQIFFECAPLHPLPEIFSVGGVWIVSGMTHFHLLGYNLEMLKNYREFS